MSNPRVPSERVTDAFLAQIAPDGDCRVDIVDAYRMAQEIKQLRAQLAQAEPVAWMTNETPPRVASAYSRDGMFASAKESYCIPLYTAPPCAEHDRLAQWQPIAIAPENEIVLLVCRNKTNWIASRHDDEWLDMGDPPGEIIDPTHWMPLPAAPEERGEKAVKRDCIHGQLARSCEICERDAEIARMRPVYRAAMRWYKDPNTGTGYESEMDLTHACARAARKGK